MIGSPKYDVKDASVIDNDTGYCFLPGIREKNGYQYTTFLCGAFGVSIRSLNEVSNCIHESS